MADPFNTTQWADVEENRGPLVDNPNFETQQEQEEWVDFDKQDAEQTYVPPALKGSNYENQAQDVQRALFSKGSQGFDTAVNLDHGSVEWALNVFKGVNPDVAAKVQRISQERKIPFEQALTNKEEWAQWQEALDITKTLIEKDEQGQFKYPYTARWLSAPDKMAMAKDDVATLAEIESTMREFHQAKEGTAKQIYRSLQYGLGQFNESLSRLPAAVYDAFAMPQNFIAENFNIPSLSVRAPEWLRENKAAEYYEGQKKAWMPAELEKDMFTYLNKGDVPGAAKNIFYQVVGNAPQQMIILSAALAGAPGVGLGTAGAIQMSETSQRATEFGKTPFNTALDSILSGTAEAAFESIGTFGILRQIEKSVAKSFGKQTAKQVIKETGYLMGKAFLTEGNEELWTSYAQDFSDFITGNAQAMQGSFQRAVNAFFVGGVSGVGMTSPTAIASGVAKSNRLNRDLKFWDQLTGVSQNSKLKQRSPEAFADFVEKASEQSDVPKKFSAPLDAFEEFYQEKPKELNKLFQDLGVQDQVEEARKTGAEIEIPTSQWAAKYAGTEISAAIRDVMRFDPNGMTVAEQANLQDEIARNVAEMQEEYDQTVDNNTLPAQAVTMRNQLMMPQDQGGFGLKAEDADAQMSVFMSGAKVLSKKGGETVEEWFNRVNPVLEIGGKIAFPGQDALRQNANFDAELTGLRERFRDQGVTLNAYGAKDTGIHLSKIEVPKSERGKGKATEAMNELISFADSTGIRVTLTPTNEFGASKKRLIQFYKRFGFVENKGRNKDFTTRETMYRKPSSTYRQDPDGVAYNQEGKINRDENFKKWFGDSKVVDEKGEPLVVYHGSNAVFDKFDFSFIGEQGSAEGYGFYFTDDKSTAQGYINSRKGPGALYETYVTIQKPMRLDQPVFSPETIEVLMETIAKKEMEFDPEGIEDVYDTSIYSNGLTVEMVVEGNDNAVDQIAELANIVGSKEMVLTAVKEVTGYDGIVSKGFGNQGKGGGTIYVPFTPTQIKSVNNQGTFDPNDPNIYRQDVALPEFTGTEEAVAFGQYAKDNKGILDLMKQQREELLKESRELLKNPTKENLNEGQLKAFRAQLLREALEGAQGKITIEGLEQKKAKIFERFDTFFQAKDRSSPVAGSVKFTDSETIISLFNSANLSTFLHESSHVFTEEMRKLVEAGVADEQLQKDYQTLLDYGNGKLDRATHEKIARAFEKYLMEGKAPNTKLAEAFRRFKAWLTAIYSAISGFDVEINDEIRGVFDRILASEQEIEQAKQYYEAKKSLLDVLEPTAKQRKKVEKAKRVADDQAYSKQLQQYMNAYYKAIGGKQALKELATREIEDQPVYKAVDEAVKAGGIDSTTLSKEDIKQLKTKHSKMLKKGGPESIDTLAAKYEYESPQALLNDMLLMERKQDAIRKRTNELIRQREAEMLEQIRAQEGTTGEEALHSEAQMNYLLAEAEVLAAKLVQQGPREVRKLEAKVFKDAAEDIISNKKVSAATRYDMYARSEQKYAKQAYALAESGDLVAAHEAKKKQLINHALVQAAIRARDEKLKIENTYKATNLKKRVKNVENSYANVALDLVNTYNLTKSDTLKVEAQNLQALKELDEVLHSMIPEWLLNKTLPEGFQSYRDLTMQQLRELNDTIQSVLHYGRDELKSLQEEGFNTVEELATASITEMDTLKDKEIYDEFDIKGRFLNKVDGLASGIKMTEFVFERLDGYKKTKTDVFGPLRKVFNRGVKAEGEYYTLKQQAFDAATKHWEVLYQAKKRLTAQFGGEAFNIKGVPVTPEMQKLGRFRWTPERLVAFILNMGNEGNMQALENSFGYTQQQRETIASLFTSQELNAIQGIWDATDLLFPALDKAHFKIYNRHVAKVEAKPLTLSAADGKIVTLKGGYYPLMFDHNISDIVAKRAEKAAAEDDLMKNRQATVLRSTKPKDGMTYSRTPGHSLPPDLTLGVWFRHIADTARYASHAEYMRDLNRLTTHPEWRQTVRDKAGRDAYKHIRTWVNYQARPERQMVDEFSKHLEKQRALATVAILGANISVGVKQRLSMFSAIKEVGIGNILQAYRDLDMKGSVVGMSNSQMWQKIESLSVYMRARGKAIDRELSDAKNRMNPFVKKFNIAGKEFAWKDVQDFMFAWIQLNDRATVGVVWNAAYNQYLQKHNGMTDEVLHNEAVKHADSIVRMTQPSALSIDLNSLQRTEGMMRLFTAFMTWTFKYANRVGFNYKGWREGAISNKDYMRHFLYEVLMAPWGAAIISSFFLTGDLPEWWEFITAPVEAVVAGVPLARDVVSQLKYRKGVGSSPAFEGYDRIVNLGKTSWELMAGEKEFQQFLWDLGRAIEFQAGVPALNFVKQVNRAYNNILDQ